MEKQEIKVELKQLLIDMGKIEYDILQELNKNRMTFVYTKDE